MRRQLVTQLEPGVVLGKTLYNERGDALLKKGTVLSARYLQLLAQRGFSYVYIQDEDTADVVVEDTISERVRTMATKSVFRYLEVLDRAVKKTQPERAADLRSAEFRREASVEAVYTSLYQAAEAIIDEVLAAPILSGLNAIKTHDNYTFCHSVDVTITAVMIGKKIYLDRDSLRQLALGCLLHDTGKIFIDPMILNKEGPLTPEEFAEIKRHPKLGYDMLRNLQRDQVLANHIAYQHHERQDGAGYPRGLQGNNRIPANGAVGAGRILPIAEIAAIADVYDALSSDRPYRPGMAPDRIVEIMRQLAGPSLNRALVGHFLSVLPVFPVGIEVVVVSGKYQYYRGVVVRVNEQQLDRPVVRLLWTPKRHRIAPIDLDLAVHTDLTIATVLV